MIDGIVKSYVAPFAFLTATAALSLTRISRWSFNLRKRRIWF